MYRCATSVCTKRLDLNSSFNPWAPLGSVISGKYTFLKNICFSSDNVYVGICRTSQSALNPYGGQQRKRGAFPWERPTPRRREQVKECSHRSWLGFISSGISQGSARGQYCWGGGGSPDLKRSSQNKYTHTHKGRNCGFTKDTHHILIGMFKKCKLNELKNTDRMLYIEHAALLWQNRDTNNRFISCKRLGSYLRAHLKVLNNLVWYLRLVTLDQKSTKHRDTHGLRLSLNLYLAKWGAIWKMTFHTPREETKIRSTTHWH